MLLSRLPEEAWCYQAEGAPVERWTVDRELLAQIADHLTVLAADRRYKEPVRVPRPDEMKVTPRGGDGAETPRGAPASPAEVAAFFRSRRVSARG